METKAQAKKTTAQKKPVTKTSAKKTSPKQPKESAAGNGQEKSKFDETMASVVAGASKGMEKVGEEAPKIAAKTSEVAKEGYGKLKKGLSVAYREAKEQADRFKHTMEMRKLKSRREHLCAELGKAAYSDIVADGKSAAEVFSKESLVQLTEQIRQVDEEIVEVAKELEES